MLESYGAFEMKFVDPKNERNELKLQDPNQQIDVIMPVSQSYYSNYSRANFYYYSPSSGIWY
jgi:hypothetical protein